MAEPEEESKVTEDEKILFRIFRLPRFTKQVTDSIECYLKQLRETGDYKWLSVTKTGKEG